jgi:hypothetical protein
LIIIHGVFAINMPCFGSPLWENRSLWFWKEKVGFGLAIWAGLIRCPVSSRNIANLAINIRYSGIFFASMKLRFYVSPLGFWLVLALLKLCFALVLYPQRVSSYFILLDYVSSLFLLLHSSLRSSLRVCSLHSHYLLV